jgi:putative oxidoreductase
VKWFGFPIAGPPNVTLFSMLGAAGIIEIVCGTLVALGLFTRYAAIIISGQMAVAYWMFHAPASFYPILNSGDAAILYTFVFLLFVFTGPGAWSLDSLLNARSRRSGTARATRIDVRSLENP